MNDEPIFQTITSDTPGEWLQEIPTARLRWFGDTLQQAWEIRRSCKGSLASVSEQWRDIPRVAVAANAPPLLAMGDPIPPGGCGCRHNGVPVMRAQCALHR
jgi:hypothetical protein